MSCHQEEITTHLKEVLQHLEQRRGRQFAAKLQFILYKNLDRCRIQRYLSENETKTVHDYVDRVVCRYDVIHDYVNQVQVQKMVEVWEPLLEKIRAWAYQFLKHWHLDKETRISYAIDIAHDASIEIIHAHFPYDCNFDAWACVLVHNTCSRHMRGLKSSFLSENPNDLSEAEEWLDSSSLPHHHTVELPVVERHDLLQAIAQLTDNQRELIWSHYFEGKTLSLIAKQSGVTTGAVYKRHFDALERLRKILGPDWYKYE